MEKPWGIGEKIVADFPKNVRIMSVKLLTRRAYGCTINKRQKLAACGVRAFWGRPTYFAAR